MMNLIELLCLTDDFLMFLLLSNILPGHLPGVATPGDV